MNCQMGNEHGKLAKSAAGVKKKHTLKESQSPGGDLSSPQGVNVENGHLVDLKEAEKSFRADREKRNNLKKDLILHITSNKPTSDLQEPSNQDDTCSLSSSHDCTKHHGDIIQGDNKNINHNSSQDCRSSGAHDGDHSIDDIWVEMSQSIHPAGLPENKTKTICSNAPHGEHPVTDDFILQEQSYMASNSPPVITFPGDQSGTPSCGSSYAVKSDISNEDSSLITSPGDRSDDVSHGPSHTMDVCNSDDKPQPRNYPVTVPKEDYADSPHSGSDRDPNKPTILSGHVLEATSDTPHEDDSTDDQNADSTSTTVKCRVPTTGVDVCNNSEQKRSKKSFPQEQTEYISDTALNWSISHTAQPKIESSTPSTMQLVPGLTEKTGLTKEGENLKVGDQLISKVVTDNALLLEKLSKYLDRESRIIKCWKHLAYVLNVPAEETRKFDLYTEHSPTEDLFNFLADIQHPELKVRELKDKLKAVHRNDVVDNINKGGYTDDMTVSDLVSGKPTFLALLSSKLDMESRTVGTWKSLATQFGIRKQKTEQFGLRGSGPTGALFLHVSTDQKLCELTMGQLREHFIGMERKDLVNLLKKLHFEENDTRLVKNEVVDGSELLADIGERLNKEIRAVKNWRNLAYRLKIPHEVYDTFDTSKAAAKSPTKLMFEWLARWNPDLSIDDLLTGLEQIDRFDVVDLVRKETSTARKAFSKLQEMRQNADKLHMKTNLSHDLEVNASKKGFEIIYNEGEGNCIFYALSDQLKLKKEIDISHQDLREKLVQYLSEHPKLSDGTDLAGFISKYPSWTVYLQEMTKDGTWGDNLILYAAANYYECDIRVISSVPHFECVVTPVPPISNAVQLVLGHIVEEHYVSLRPSISALSTGSAQVLSDGGCDLPNSQSTRYEVPPTLPCSSNSHYPKIQDCLEQQEHQQSPCNPTQLGHLPLQGNHQAEDRKPVNSSFDKNQRAVKDLPYAVYGKICLKLNIRRDFFNDFRMVAEELGLDRDTTELAGQDKNPTDFIFTQCYRNVTVRRLIGILHKIERMDVAEVLENWVANT